MGGEENGGSLIRLVSGVGILGGLLDETLIIDLDNVSLYGKS